MTLSNVDIEHMLDYSWITIDPFEPKRLQAGSYDCVLGNEFLRFSDSIDMTTPWEPQNLWRDAEYLEEDDLFILGAGEFALGTTTEQIGVSTKVAGQVWGKSSLGRMGLSIHVTAGYIDPGFSGQITLELYNLSPVPIALKAGMPICQIVFDLVETEAYRGYQGKYAQQLGVTPSRYHLNYT